jgi:hypothetical protein
MDFSFPLSGHLPKSRFCFGRNTYLQVKMTTSVFHLSNCRGFLNRFRWNKFLSLLPAPIHASELCFVLYWAQKGGKNREGGGTLWRKRSRWHTHYGRAQETGYRTTCSFTATPCRLRHKFGRLLGKQKALIAMVIHCFGSSLSLQQFSNYLTTQCLFTKTSLRILKFQTSHDFFFCFRCVN